MNKNFIPYGRQIIDDEDIQAVVDVLRSSYLTTGPAVAQFESHVCAFCGAEYAIAVNSGTAALHCAMHALGIGLGDEVIVPPITFAATANAILYTQAKPVFADVQASTLLLDPTSVEAAITPHTKAIIGVDYAGQPCDWDALRSIAHKHKLALVADACHALGAEYKGRKVGTLADITVFSFHPVKNMTTGEGGMAVTNNEEFATRMRHFREHGITSTAAEREKMGGWHYEMHELGFNYRITDFQCALGSSQLKKLPQWIEKRNILAQNYGALFANSSVQPLTKRNDCVHAYHLYVVRVQHRNAQFETLRKANIGVNVHYMPVYLHPYYQNLGYKNALCPEEESAFRHILTLPLWAELNADTQQKIFEMLR